MTPTPYYADDLTVLYLGDCREVPEWLSADVLVTDPPYGIGYESNFNRDRRDAKKGRAITGDAGGAEGRDAVLASWGTRPAVVFGRWDAPRPALTRVRLIWDKGNSPGMGDLSSPWGRSDEEIYILGHGFTGARSGSVLRIQMLMSGDHNRPDHPTPKPVALMTLLLTKCPPGVVADPFAGSGSTLVAAKLLGRRAVGVEIDERYCEIAARRLSQSCLDFDEEAS